MHLRILLSLSLSVHSLLLATTEPRSREELADFALYAVPGSFAPFLRLLMCLLLFPLCILALTGFAEVFVADGGAGGLFGGTDGLVVLAAWLGLWLARVVRYMSSGGVYLEEIGVRSIHHSCSLCHQRHWLQSFCLRCS